MMSLLSSILLVMVVWARHHTNLASAEGIVISNSKAALTEYWQTMLPNSRMPLAILELLPTSAGYVDHMEKQDTDHIHTPNKGTGVKYVGTSLLKARKIGLHSTSEAKEKTEIDSQKLPLWIWAWAPHTNGDDEKVQHIGRVPTTMLKDQKNILTIWGWGPQTSGDDEKVQHLVRRQATNTDNHKNILTIWGWGPKTSGDDDKVHHLVRRQATNTDNHKNILTIWGWGPQKKKGDKTTRHMVGEAATETSDVPEDDGHQGMSHNHDDESTVSKFIFHEDALRPGSTIIPYVQPSATSHAPLLRRDIADVIPMSTRNFTDILEMFAPASHAMADDIWMMLDLCENPRPIKGEKKTCATSLESMVEFAASVLTGGNTHDLRALSSPDVPAEGVTSGRKYNVVAARKATESNETMTCHGMSFPFTVFMCHAVNPTRTYELTLESEDLTSRVVVLAVCHLDTSEFNPAKMPGHAKPGDEPACHFIGRDNVLWAPGSPAAAAA